MVFISESWLTRRLLALPFPVRTDPRLTATELVLEYRVCDAIDGFVSAHCDDSPGGETAPQNGGSPLHVFEDGWGTLAAWR